MGLLGAEGTVTTRDGQTLTLADFKSGLKGLSADEKKEALRQFEKLAVQQEVERMQAREGSLQGRARNTVQSGLLRLGNAATLGTAPRIAGLLSEQEGFRTRVGLEAAKQNNPIASTAGDIGGLLVGPGAAALRGAGALAVRGGGALTSRVVPMTPQSVRTLLESRAVSNVARGFAQGTGALVALRGAEDSQKSIAERASLVYHDVKSPLFIGTTVGLGLVSARAQSVNDRETRDFLMDLRRHARKEGLADLTPDLVTDSARVKNWMDRLFTDRPDLKQKAAQMTVRSWRRMLQATAKELGAGGSDDVLAASPKAAGVARRLVGGSRAQSAVVAQRRAVQGGAAEQYLTREISGDQLRPIFAEINRAVRAERGRIGGLSRDMKGALQDFRRLYIGAMSGRGRSMRLQDIEDMIGETDRIAGMAQGFGQQLGNVTTGDARLAGTLSSLLRAKRAALSPEWVEVQQWAQALRRQEEALRGVKLSDLDDKTAEAFFAGKNAITNWRTAVQHGTPEDVGALRAWLFWNFASKVGSRTQEFGSELPLTSSIKSALRASGPTNHQLMEEVFPGLARRMTVASRVFDRSRKASGVLSDLGSATAKRTSKSMIGQFTGSPLASMALAYGIYNQFPVAGSAIGAAVTLRELNKRASRSLLTFNRNLVLGPQTGLIANQAALGGLNTAVPAAAGARAQEEVSVPTNVLRQQLQGLMGTAGPRQETP